MNLVYTDVAIQDLKRLRAFIEINNPQAAAQIAARLIEKINLLRSFPTLGVSVTQAPENGTVRDIIFDNYIVRYSVHSQTIIILKLWHNLEQRM
ncbi:type II toxin-antitoxin system RelE/ParE family toxin [Pseudidiomarina donghaiensis]|uniref:Type II toxin-antitoxin system RelE/ParE family toxin n=1 Tax=Pseudidiomarina donghaiensis TaxID=519452 RepID=A0A432XIM0_9GAMM|nr:type II toxin-antitoxin system RelE/ParE family toxin [Pseudidiomarina donghaiensis]